MRGTKTVLAVVALGAVATTGIALSVLLHEEISLQLKSGGIQIESPAADEEPVETTSSDETEPDPADAGVPASGGDTPVTVQQPSAPSDEAPEPEPQPVETVEPAPATPVTPHVPPGKPENPGSQGNGGQNPNSGNANPNSGNGNPNR